MGTSIYVSLLAAWIASHHTAAVRPASQVPVVVVPTAAHARLIEPVAGRQVVVKWLVESPADAADYRVLNEYVRGLSRADLLLVDQGASECEVLFWTERLANCGGPKVADFPAAAFPRPRGAASLDASSDACGALADALSDKFPEFRAEFQANARTHQDVQQVAAGDSLESRED